ncbi:MAG: FAD-binding oxidoreductase [Rhodospirillaceae bacterium]|nr:MAG: FAD-binding oxidoreductase [Rhodospirillaceae bacterium]
MFVLILLQVGLHHHIYICIPSGLPTKEDVELPELSENKRKFTVLGAGVVGLCCAVSLQRAGFSVTLVDRLDPGTGTSFGNAGLIQIDSVVPIATPGILRNVPSMLLDPLGPLVVRWRYLHRIAPWLARFVRAARPDNVERISIALASLLDRSNEAWLELITAANAQDVWRESGELHVYRTKQAWESSRASDELRRRRGSVLEELTVEEMRQLEPALSPNLYRGIFTPNANSIIHPLDLSQRLFDLFRRSGGTFVKTNVTGFRNGPDGEPIWLSTDGESLPVDGLVIAAGAFSKPFAKSAGASVPLDTERGYHLWLPDPGVEMRRPIVVGDHKFGIVPMTGGVRLVGTVEFGGLDLAPDWRRADILAKLARPFVPGLNIDGAERWMGYRPSMPDSLPVIGRAPGKQNVYLAFGHGHLGLTMGAVTGQVITGLAAGRSPDVDLVPFRAERF